MTSEKSYATEQRLNALINTATAWASMGSMSNGWSVSGSGHAKYRLNNDGMLVLAFRLLVPGTTTDNTVIWSSANGFPVGFRRINTVAVIPGATDHTSNPAALGFESAAIILGTDGSVQILGLAGAGNATRMDVWGTFPLDD